jgi:hypothetical protein
VEMHPTWLESIWTFQFDGLIYPEKFIMFHAP